jgi:hypothetical protein
MFYILPGGKAIRSQAWISNGGGKFESHTAVWSTIERYTDDSSNTKCYAQSSVYR